MTTESFEGGCTCGAVRYRLESPPLFIHCCHCTWCQRQTGSSYALNALIESDRLTVLQGNPEVVDTPSPSGKGQRIWRCPDCRIALWSHYAGFGDAVSFARVGTLDEAGRLSPDVHIFTSAKQPWVQIPDAHPAFEDFYKLKEQWPDESRARLRQALGDQ